MGWFPVILLALLAGGGWFAVVAYADHLALQGRYDQALRLLQFLPAKRAARSRFRAYVLTDSGRYEEAEHILRDSINHARGKKVTKVTRVTNCFDLEDLGIVLIDTGRFEEAQQCFRSAAGMSPYHSVWATGMAEALLRQGIFPERALEHAERALNLFQRGAERISCGWRLGTILATKAWALAACGHETEARNKIYAALKSPARKTKGPLAEIHYKAGMSFLALADHRTAEEHFALGAGLDPAGRWGRLCADAIRGQTALGIEGGGNIP